MTSPPASPPTPPGSRWAGLLRRSARGVAGIATVAVLGACAGASDEVEPDPTSSGPVDDTDTVDPDDAPASDEDDAAADPDPEAVVEEVATGLDDPWGLAFLPDGERLLVTMRAGRLALVDTTDGEVTDIAGVPEVAEVGQGGLLDVAVASDLEESGDIYLTYAAGDGTGATTTHLARARLDVAAAELTEVEVLFVAEPFLDSGRHFGSRVELDPDGDLLVSIGDRGDDDRADHVSQDTSNALGSVVRVAPDGSVPEDNPFVGDEDVLDEILTYGHRNIQGLAVHPDGQRVFVSEHGEEDGDSIGILEPGGNHGWPLAHTGCDYGTQTPVGDDPFERDDIVDPVFVWECGSGGFPPAGMAFVSGDAFPAWEGSLLVGGLATQQLARFKVDGDQVELAETLLDDQGWRIRDVAVSPADGAIYLAIDGAGVPLVRLVPAER